MSVDDDIQPLAATAFKSAVMRDIESYTIRLGSKKIYLAHGRDDAAAVVEKLLAPSKCKGSAVVIDPWEQSRQGCVKEFVSDDLELVKDSDLVLAYHAYHVYGGLAVECGYAHALGIPIVYVCKEPRLDSMLCGIAVAVFTELTPALEYIDRKYLSDAGA